MSERIEAYQIFPIGMSILTVFASKQNIRKLGSSEYSLRIGELEYISGEDVKKNHGNPLVGEIDPI